MPCQATWNEGEDIDFLTLADPLLNPILFPFLQGFTNKALFISSGQSSGRGLSDSLFFSFFSLSNVHGGSVQFKDG